MSYEIVSAALDSVPCPASGVIIDVVEFEPGYFAYRMYRDNIEDYSDPMKSSIFEWIKDRAKVAMDLGNCQVGLDMAEYPSEGENNNGTV